MILQALTAYYQQLSRQGVIAPPGWGRVKISYALCIDETGSLRQTVCVKGEEHKGKKIVMVPQEMVLPAPVKKTSGVLSNFLWENPGYLLGIDGKGDPAKSAKCFAASKALHEKLLSGVDSPAARGILRFFQNWDPEKAAEHPALQEALEDILKGVNLTFLVNFQYAYEDPLIRHAWERYYAAKGADGPEMICLVTGVKGPVERVHPAIKNVRGAQSSGAALVSFNAPAFCSYGAEQNLNAPTGRFAAFAYTTALNHLLADWRHVYYLGDTAVICWAESAQPAYQDLFGGCFMGSEYYDAGDLDGMVKALCAGQAVLYDQTLLDPEMEFYVLGLAPNAARLSVRFFLKNTFGKFLENARAHQQRLEIVRPSYDKFPTIPVWKLLDETVNQNSRDKQPAPRLGGELLRSILENTPYPATLLNGVTLRIRAQRQITRGQAAIIKAYYLKNNHPDVPKEVLTVHLNPDCEQIPYTLGRLFSLLDAIQDAANPGINTTIRDKYFSSASATPAIVFPTLVNLAQKHLRKLNPGTAVYYDRQLTELMSKLPRVYPARLNLPQQGSFQLGYYHQNQSRYQKKEKKENA